MDLELAPADAPGHIQLNGHVVLPTTAAQKSAAPSAAAAANGAAAAIAGGPEPLDMKLQIKDAGMSLISTVLPAFQWQSGNASIQVGRRCLLPSLDNQNGSWGLLTKLPPIIPTAISNFSLHCYLDQSASQLAANALAS